MKYKCVCYPSSIDFHPHLEIKPPGAPWLAKRLTGCLHFRSVIRARLARQPVVAPAQTVSTSAARVRPRTLNPHSHSASTPSPVEANTPTLMKQSLQASKAAKTMKRASEQLGMERILQVLKASRAAPLQVLSHARDMYFPNISIQHPITPACSSPPFANFVDNWIQYSHGTPRMSHWPHPTLSMHASTSICWNHVQRRDRFLRLYRRP
ncbi:hypothetical protein BD779DRAFT_498666 [Infundibulicybe gibba]|nr:hypothetical protein BD779DRAFT_498666 [Infundibulicybe gibba]